MLRREREIKRVKKKEHELKTKSELRQKMSVIATNTAGDNDEELALPKKVWEHLHQSGFENNEEDSDMDGSDADDESGEASVEEESDSDVDDAHVRINKMAADMEYNIKKQKDYQM